MAFKSTHKKPNVANTPELMYDDYKQKEVKELTSSQGVVVREYEKHVEDKDLALELPTGSGKTLVGLVIGEWRRAKKDEKVLFLCPTRQLVKQVEEQAKTVYGINVTAYLGPKAKFSDESKTNWRMNKTIAVATYSAFFNSGSFFDGAEVVIFDDAHSAENYIGKMWTLDVEKEADPALFSNLVSVLREDLSHLDYLRLTDEEEEDSLWVEMLPGPTFYKVVDAISSSVNAYLTENDNNPLVFSWRAIKDHLLACNLFLSKRSLIIRPLIPPTETFQPFHSLKQRIYMSATLGKGGELERITGVKNIVRIKSPEKWKTRAVGRRLVFFPELIHASEKYQIARSLIDCSGRALLMSASENAANKFQNKINELGDSIQFVNAKDFETDASSFLDAENAVLCFANRYDGLDLSGDKCRLLILDSISKMLNLQDQFLFEKIGARDVFLDRINTRLTQAIGRCTRSENDFSLALVMGERLTDLYYDKRYRNHLVPEIQAEIRFGAEESSHGEYEASTFVENFKVFLDQGDEWREAEKKINQYREEMSRAPIAGEEDLSLSVKHEIDCVYDLWKESYKDALDSAKSVLGKLNHEDLKGYRTFWNYYAGYISFLLSKSGDNSSLAKAITYFDSAAKSSIAIKWFSRLVHEVSPEQVNVSTENSSEIEQLDNLMEIFNRDGVSHNGKFDKRVTKILDYTENGNSSAFETSQVELGKILGFKSGKRESDASPDPWWYLDSENILVFEDNSDANEEGILSATKARQAATHSNWLRAELELEKKIKIHQVLVTPKVKLAAGAAAQIRGAGVSLWPLNDYKKWVSAALGVIREARKDASSATLMARSSILEKLDAGMLTPNKILKHLDAMKVK